jgi:hypothetical protein
MELSWLFFGHMPLAHRIARLRRARDMIRQRLADSEMTIEGLKADLVRVENALADCQAAMGKRFL